MFEHETTVLKEDLSTEFVFNGEQLASYLFLVFNQEGLANEDKTIEALLVDLKSRVKTEPQIYVVMMSILNILKLCIDAEIKQATKEEKTKVMIIGENTIEQALTTIQFFRKKADTKAQRIYQLIVDIIKTYKHYSHMSDVEIGEFNRLASIALQAKQDSSHQDGTKVLTAHFDYSMKLYQERADVDFLDNYPKIHWLIKTDDFRQLLNDQNQLSSPNQWELSTVAYHPDEEVEALWGTDLGIGVELDGEVIWASNEDARSDNRFPDIPEIAHRKFPWGDGQALIMGYDSFLKAQQRVDEALMGNGGHNEVILKRWKIKALVVDKDKVKEKNKQTIDELIGIAKNHDIIVRFV